MKPAISYMGPERIGAKCPDGIIGSLSTGFKASNFNALHFLKVGAWPANYICEQGDEDLSPTSNAHHKLTLN